MTSLFGANVNDRPSIRGALATGCGLLALGCAALALGCAAPAPAVSFAVSRFVHEPPERIGEDVVAWGLDLDGRHDTVEGTGCTRAIDFVSPAGEPGVDNQYAAALVGWLDAALGDTTGAVNAADAPGWILDVTGIDDLRDDVTVEVWEATRDGVQLVRSVLVVRAPGTVRGDWLDVDLGTLALPMGLEIGHATVEGAHLRVRIFPGRDLTEATTGDLAGRVRLPDVLAVSRVFEPSLDLPATERMAMPDLDADGDGTCEAVSLGVGLELTRLAP